MKVKGHVRFQGHDPVVHKKNNRGWGWGLEQQEWDQDGHWGSPRRLWQAAKHCRGDGRLTGVGGGVGADITTARCLLVALLREFWRGNGGPSFPFCVGGSCGRAMSAGGA
jgi:hypothetical protein